jgi:hypothetical protein
MCSPGWFAAGVGFRDVLVAAQAGLQQGVVFVMCLLQPRLVCSRGCAVLYL